MLHLVMSKKMFTNMEIVNNGTYIFIILNFTTSLSVKKTHSKKGTFPAPLTTTILWKKTYSTIINNHFTEDRKRNTHGWVFRPLLAAEYRLRLHQASKIKFENPWSKWEAINQETQDYFQLLINSLYICKKTLNFSGPHITHLVDGMGFPVKKFLLIKVSRG